MYIIYIYICIIYLLGLGVRLTAPPCRVSKDSASASEFGPLFTEIESTKALQGPNPFKPLAKQQAYPEREPLKKRTDLLQGSC